MKQDVTPGILWCAAKGCARLAPPEVLAAGSALARDPHDHDAVYLALRGFRS